MYSTLSQTSQILTRLNLSGAHFNHRFHLLLLLSCSAEDGSQGHAMLGKHSIIEPYT